MAYWRDSVIFGKLIQQSSHRRDFEASSRGDVLRGKIGRQNGLGGNKKHID